MTYNEFIAKLASLDISNVKRFVLTYVDDDDEEYTITWND